MLQQSCLLVKPCLPLVSLLRKQQLLLLQPHRLLLLLLLLQQLLCVGGWRVTA
jgi:hypothetical protein